MAQRWAVRLLLSREMFVPSNLLYPKSCWPKSAETDCAADVFIDPSLPQLEPPAFAHDLGSHPTVPPRRGSPRPWAVIAGGGSREQIGVSAFATRVRTRVAYLLEPSGAAVGLYDRVELSAARLRFGLKLPVLGDAVCDADSGQPQMLVRLQYKRNRAKFVPNLVGARRSSDTEPYVSFAKLWLGVAGGYNLFTNLTLRGTRANQMGLLGFGGQGQRPAATQQ